jgi:hypothetical protein
MKDTKKIDIEDMIMIMIESIEEMTIKDIIEDLIMIDLIEGMAMIEIEDMKINMAILANMELLLGHQVHMYLERKPIKELMGNKEHKAIKDKELMELKAHQINKVLMDNKALTVVLEIKVLILIVAKATKETKVTMALQEVQTIKISKKIKSKQPLQRLNDYETHLNILNFYYFAVLLLKIRILS